jgi:hypothetical protein
MMPLTPKHINPGKISSGIAEREKKKNADETNCITVTHNSKVTRYAIKHQSNYENVGYKLNL